jgi:hypothetical protein
MTQDIEVEKPLAIIPMSRSSFIRVLLLGGAVGLLILGLGYILNRFVFDVYFCQGEVSSQCGSAKNYAVAAASLVGVVVSLWGLIRLTVYRPLLVVIASMLGTWSIIQLSWNLDIVTRLLVAVLFYGSVFGLFAWVSRIREFWITLLVIVLLVVGIRLVLMA